MAGQVWSVNSLGGYMASFNLSEELRMAVQPMTKFRQFADVKDATQQGKKKGQTYTWDVYQDVATRAAQTLAETNTMPETNYTIVQSTLTIAEGGNSVPYTEMLDNLSMHPVKTIIQKVLKNDAAKWFDASAFTQFNATPIRASVTTSTTSLTVATNGTSVTTNSIAFRKQHANMMLDLLTERNIPPYTANDYYAIGWPTAFTSLRQDLEAIQQYTSEGLERIMAGEIGRYNSIRFVQQTNIPKGGAANSSTFNAFTNTADAWDNGLSDWIFFCGADTVAEAICVPEEMRGKIPSDYGRSKGVAWYYLGGFGLVHALDAANNSRNARIIKWDSAA